MVMFLFLIIFLQILTGTSTDLHLEFYQDSCLEAENIVRNVMKKTLIREPRSLAFVMRFQFHDCFVNGCDASKFFRLKIVIPSYVLSIVVQLETLTVSHCDSLDTIYDLQGVNIGEACEKLAMQLRNLSLDNLSNLRNIRSDDSYSFLSFDSLQTVHVIHCQCLRRIFSASLAKRLVQLEQLHIEACGIEEIIGNEGQVDVDISFVLPQITVLILWNLSKLKRFFPGKYTLDCPELKALNIWGCDRMELFGTEPTTFIATHDQAVGQLEV